MLTHSVQGCLVPTTLLRRWSSENSTLIVLCLQTQARFTQMRHFKLCSYKKHICKFSMLGGCHLETQTQCNVCG